MIEKYIVEINLCSSEIPQFWINFYKHIHPKKPMSVDGLVRHINCELQTYNVKFIHGSTLKLEFESEKDYVNFILKWS